MLTREPPDGKEKPEPPRHQKHGTLSRKNSKCDLLDTHCGASLAPQENSVVSACDASSTQPSSPRNEHVYGAKRSSISAAAQAHKADNQAYVGDMVDS